MFRLPTRNISDAISGAAPYQWVKPADWLNIPEVIEGEDKVVGLLALNEHSFQTQICTGFTPCRIDWGDGIIEEFTSPPWFIDHVYDYANLPSNLGIQKQVVVTVTPLEGERFTTIRFKEQGTAPSDTYNRSWMDINISGSEIESCIVQGLISLERFNFVGTNKIAYLYQFFADCGSLNSVVNFNSTVDANDVRAAFKGCKVLVSAPKFNTSQITNFYQMYEGCSSLVNVPEIDMTNAISMSRMFYQCSSLIKNPLINTGNVSDMSYGFYACRSLRDISGLTFDSTTNLAQCFKECYSITEVENLNAPLCTNFTSLFDSCYSLIRVKALNTSSGVSMGSMFDECSSLVGLPNLELSNCTNMGGMFSYCTNLRYLPALDTANVTFAGAAFMNCESISRIPDLDFSKVTYLGSAFQNCKSLIETPNITTTAALTNLYYCFGLCDKLIKINPFDTSGVTDMGRFLYGNPRLKVIPAFDVSSVTSMSYMLFATQKITKIDIRNISTSIDINGTSMEGQDLTDFLLGFSDMTSQASPTVTIASYRLDDLDPSVRQSLLDKNWTIAG
jgi:hypothetical protein